MQAPSSPWKTVGWIAGIALLLCCGGVGGVLAYFSTQPEGGVRLGNRMEPYALEALATRNILLPGEQIVAYFDATIGLDGGEAAVLTNQRLVYHVDRRVTAIPANEIADVQRRDEGALGDTIEVTGVQGTRIQIVVPPMHGVESLHQALLDAWQRARAAQPSR